MNDFLNSFHKIIAVLELQIKVSNEEILVVHERFLKSQRMHNSQLNCERWIKSVLLDTDHHLLTPTTIFDEAYIQHRLRSHGVEIHCDGLEIFPRNSLDMKKIIYKT